MADDFLQNLRMANIYGGANPFTPSTPNPNDIALGFIDQLRMRRAQDEINPWTAAGYAQLGKPLPTGAPPVTKPMNVTTGINPYQQAQLEQKRAEMQSREKLGEEGIQSREQIAAGGAASREKIAGGAQDIQRQKAADYGRRTDILAWKAQHPGFDIKAQRGGNFIAINKGTGEAMDTGMDTGTMSEEGLQNLKNEGVINAVEEKGAQARQTAETIAGLPPRTNELETQKRTGAQNRYNIIINQHPEWRKFISLDPNSSMPVVAPVGTSTGWLGGGTALDDKTRSQIMSQLYPEGNAAPTKSAETAKPTPTKSKTVRVKDDKGNTGTVSEEDSKNLPKGWSILPSTGAK